MIHAALGLSIWVPSVTVASVNYYPEPWALWGTALLLSFLVFSLRRKKPLLKITVCFFSGAAAFAGSCYAGSGDMLQLMLLPLAVVGGLLTGILSAMTSFIPWIIRRYSRS